MITPQDLLDEPIILREPVAGTREILFDTLRENDIYPHILTVAMELGNAEAIEMAVEEGIGVAFISCLAAERGLKLEYVIEIKVSGLMLSRNIFIVRNTTIPPVRAEKEYLAFLQRDEARNKLDKESLNIDRLPIIGKSMQFVSIR